MRGTIWKMRLIKSFSKVSFHNRPIFAHIVIGSIFLVLASFCTLTGFLPTLDTIEVHGAFHYFYSSITRGIIPYWNPHSQTGMPFFNEFQTFGLLLPSQFVFVLFQKITGCTTLTTYILHFFFLYYVFVVGTYYTLQLITTRSIISLTFSMILAFACFPNFMRHDASNFFLIPFITFFSLLFFKESKVNKKGVYLFLTSFFFVTLLHKHIPMWLLFYLLLFILFAFLCKIADIKATIRFLTNQHGLFWVILSIIVVLLISSPIIVLYYELHHNTEYFPSVRFLKKMEITW